MTIVKGENGSKVYALQYALHILNYNTGEIDGSFGDATESAVKLFQSEHGLTQTGHINGGTWLSITAQIKAIQQALSERGFYDGYDTGGVDGVAGDGTYSAVLAFQTDNGLDADGMVGPYTRELLNAPADATVIGTTSSTLSLGSNGSLTRYLKYVLTVLGYNLHGIFQTRLPE